MSWRPHSETESTRWAELAELFTECQAVFHDVSAQTQWRAVDGSPAASDIDALSTRDPPLPDGFPRLLTLLAYTYLSSAGQQMAGLAALYAHGAVLISPNILARSIAEHSAHVLWVLGDPAQSADHRLARALLEETESALHAKNNAGRLLGKGSPEHRDRTDAYRSIKRDAASIFPEPHADTNGDPMYLGYQVPKPTEILIWAGTFVSPSRAEDESKGVYGLLSNYAHPTLYAIRELFVPVKRGGRIVAQEPPDLDYHDRLARLAIVFYYHALHYAWSYHGWAGERFAELTAQIDRLLPQTLVDPDGR